MARWICFPALALITVVAACGDDEAEDGSQPELTPGEKLCAAIGDSLERCPGQSTPCDDALLADCAALVDIVNGSFVDAARTCVESGKATATGCVVDALGALTPSEAHRELASAFCENCALGVPGCEEVFFSSDGSKYALGTVILPLGDDVTRQITEECATGLTCLGTFVNCAQQVLAKNALPTETAKCLVDTLVSGGSAAPAGSECTGSGGAGPGSGGSGPGSGGAGPGSGGSGPGSGGSGPGSGGGPGCSNPGPEPNDTRASATVQGDSISCFPIEESSKTGMVAGQADLDYWAFTDDVDVCAGSCGNADVCPTRPTLYVDQSTPGTRFCLFPECATTSVPDLLSCEAGSTYTVDGGVEGCCAVDANVVMRLECKLGWSTLTTMVVRVNQPEADECAPYGYTLTHTQ